MDTSVKSLAPPARFAAASASEPPAAGGSHPRSKHAEGAPACWRPRHDLNVRPSAWEADEIQAPFSAEKAEEGGCVQSVSTTRLIKKRKGASGRLHAYCRTSCFCSFDPRSVECHGPVIQAA